MNAVTRPSPAARALARVLSALLLAGAAAAAQTPSSPAAPSRPPDNYYAAGNRVDLAGPIDGDAVVAGRTVILDEPVSGDILAAGWRVAIEAPAADDVRVAGSEVTVSAPIQGDLTAAAGELTVERAAQIRGRAWLTGGTVRADGVFERELWIYGAEVIVGGDVRQPLHVVAQTLTILPTANLRGPVEYRGPVEARVDPAATLAAPIAYERVSSAEARRQRSSRGASSVLFALNLMVAGLILLLVVPRFAAGAVETLRTQPGLSALSGFVLLVTVPVAAVLLIVTLIGLPVGFALVAIYLVALLLGLLVAAYSVGELESRLLKRPAGVTRSQRFLVLVAGVLTLAVLRLIPLAGGLVIFAAALFGLGSVAVWSYREWAGKPTGAA